MKNQFDNFLNAASKLRDGALVTAAFLYFFGYIVWAINASVNNLGLLPALDFQYFVAGILPVSAITLIYTLFIASKFINDKIQNWLGPTASGRKLYLSWLMSFLSIAAFVLILVQDPIKAIFPNLDRSLLTVICGLIIIISYPFLKVVRNTADNFLLLYSKILAVMFFIGIAMLLFIYSVVLYPKIPQEFGGALPYHACLDIEKSQLSKQTLEGILSPDAIKSNDSVVQSLKIEVLFSGSDVMLIRSQEKVHRITKNAIQAISTCS